MSASAIEPPPLFSAVCPSIYRCATPTFSTGSSSASDYLSGLSLRTLLSLSAELPSPGLVAWCRSARVSLVHPPAAVGASRLSPDTVKDALQTLLDVRNHPILVTDTDGIHNSGIVLGCLRKLMRWNFAAITVEYRYFAGSQARAADERFIEMFDTDLVTFPPEHLMPAWFRRQLRHDEQLLDGSAD